MNVLKNFSPAILHPARQLGIATFKKTRYSSHVSFLKTCLRHRVIPNGLRVHSNCSGISHPVQSRIKAAAVRFSRQLMQSHIQHFASQARIASQDLDLNKQKIQDLCDQRQYHCITYLIHVLNKELYLSLSDTKTKKFDKLCSSKKVPLIESHTTRVVTIPDDLELTSSSSVKGFELCAKQEPYHLHLK